MDRVHTIEEKALEQMGAAALLVGTSGPNQRHIGLLHRGADGAPIYFLHLEDDRRLTNGLPLPGHAWVEPNIHRRRLPQLAAICRLVWRANERDGIPFGFGLPADCIDEENGQFLLGPTRWGLTCATFVLAVFHRAGLQLVDYSSWPADRAEDQSWFAKILTYLKRTVPDPERIPDLAQIVGIAVRFRPEEVAGAATATPRPVDFQTASERGAAIRARLPAG